MSAEHMEWAVDIPRQRKVQKQTANNVLRKNSHREVIFNDYYHTAIYVENEKLASWMQIPYKAITLELVYGTSSRYLSLIDLAHKYIHSISSTYQQNITKNKSFVMDTSGIGSPPSRVILSKEGCEWQNVNSSVIRRLGNNSSGNNYRFSDDLIAVAEKQGSSNWYTTIHFYYLEPMYDEETGELLGMDEHYIGDYTSSTYYITDHTHLTWTKNGALYGIEYLSQSGMELVEVTPSGAYHVGHLDNVPVGYNQGYSRVVQSPSGMCAFCVARPQKQSGDDLYSCYVALWFTDSYATWNSIILNSEAIKTSVSNEFRTLIIQSNGKFYVYVAEYLGSTSYYRLHLYIVSETLTSIEVELPNYIDIPIDRDYKGVLIDDEYNGYSHIRLILNKNSDEDYQNLLYYNIYAMDAFMDIGSLPFNTGARSISYSDGVIDEEREPFMLLGRFGINNNQQAYIYLDNLCFEESSNNFFFVTKQYDDKEAGEKIDPNDYVF